MWARALGALTGLWLMAAPSILHYGAGARVSDLIVGPMAVSAAIVAMSEVTRAVRWATLPLGAWVVMAPWLLGAPNAARVSGVVAGTLLMAVALVRGRLRARFGGGWAVLWRARNG
jgi:hypothetical protein